MDITPPPMPTVAPAPPSPAAGPGISADFETFLKMLTVQMTNQDPLNPIESSDYAVQLATFSGVEQQVQTNDLLKALTAQMGATGMVQMAAWVGKEARAAVAVNWTGAPVTVAAAPLQGATRAELVVRDGEGIERQRFDIPATGGPLDWAGVGPDGTPLPMGVYTFETVSYQGEAAVDAQPAEVYARIAEVQSLDGETMLTFTSGATASASAVTALRDPALSE